MRKRKKYEGWKTKIDINFNYTLMNNAHERHGEESS